MKVWIDGEIGIVSLICAAVFITLKLSGVVDWSWWWVTAPLWIGFAAVVVLGIAAAALWLFCGTCRKCFVLWDIFNGRGAWLLDVWRRIP